MRPLVALTLAAALLALCGAHPVASEGGHPRLLGNHTHDADAMLLSGAGEGKSKAAPGNAAEDDDDDEDRKTLSQQIADGKYGLLQNEIYTQAPQRPGILSYGRNPEVPRDTAKNLGGLEPDEIWLAEDHVLVLRGGWYPDHKGNRTKLTVMWPPIDNYKAPPRQVKIPSNPKVPPPFPVQLSDDGPTQFIGTNGSNPFFVPPGNGSYFAPPFPFPPPPPGNFTPENGPFPLPPPYGYPPQGNFLPGQFPGPVQPPAPPLPPAANMSLLGQPPINLPPSGNFTTGNGSLPFYPFPFPPPPPPGNLPIPPGFYPPPGNATPLGFLPPPPGYFPPGAAFLPPPGSLNDTYDEDDPSIYYPPPYDFYYPRDNTTQVPPGPLVPGIILPPPPNFFAPLNETSTTTPAPTTTTTSTERPATSIQTPPTPYPARRKKPPGPSTSLPDDDSVALNQLTTESPLRFYGKFLEGVLIGTAAPTPVSYVVVPVTDITVRPRPSTQRPPYISSNTVTAPPYRSRGGISTTIAPPLHYEAPKASYYFYEEPQVAHGHLSEAGVLRNHKGFYDDGYYYEPPPNISPATATPSTYYKVPTPSPQLYLVPSKTSPTLPLQNPHSRPLTKQFYNPQVSTPGPPIYYYVNAQAQAPRPPYVPFKSNLQYYSSRDAPFVSSRPLYQFHFQAGGLPTPTPGTTATPPVIRLASSPRTLYEYSFEKRRPSDAGRAFVTQIPPRAEVMGHAGRPQYVGQTPSFQYVRPGVGTAYGNQQYAGPTVSPGFVLTTARPQYVSVTARPSASARVKGVEYADAHLPLRIEVSTQTPHPQHAYYTPQDERLLDDITKKYFTVFGQKVGGSTTPLPPPAGPYTPTPTPTPISLDSDTLVNYRPPLPPLEPDSEYVRPGGGGDGQLISYRLPGNGAHFYFLPPQAVVSQPHQRYRRRKPPR